MILALAVLAGLLAGMVRSGVGKRKFQVTQIHHVWLVGVAVLAQWLAFYWPASRYAIPDQAAAAVLVGAQALLLLFVWLNRSRPGFWVMGIGLGLNLLVIAANGGFMPVSVETLQRLLPHASPGTFQVGSRLGWDKDILLMPGDTHFAWLSDRFLLPSWFPFQAAFSLGDSFIALGVFWMLWKMGGPVTKSSLMQVGILERLLVMRGISK